MRRRILVAFERAEDSDDEAERRRLLTFVIIGGGRPGSSWPALSPSWQKRRSPVTSATSTRPPRASFWSRPAPGCYRVFRRDCPKCRPRRCDGSVSNFGSAPRYELRSGRRGNRRRAARKPHLDLGRRSGGFACRHLARYQTRAWWAGPSRTESDAARTPRNFCDRRYGPGCRTRRTATRCGAGGQAAGRYVARLIAARLAGKGSPGPFRYRDFGNLATIGRREAVVDFGWLRLTGASRGSPGVWRTSTS